MTLPSGRVMTPPARTYLKYNPDAFVGRVVTTPNGRIVADQFWYGDAAHHLRRLPDRQPVQHRHEHPAHFGIANGVHLDIGADAINVLNHTQFSGAYIGGLGATITTPSPALGLVPGWATPRTTAPEAWRPTTRARFSCGRL